MGVVIGLVLGAFIFWLFGTTRVLVFIFSLLFLGFLVSLLGGVGTLLLILTIVNLYATYCCMWTPDVKQQKKNYQIAFVWLIPVVGALTVWYFSKPELPGQHPGKGRAYSGGRIRGTGYYSGSDAGGADGSGF